MNKPYVNPYIGVVADLVDPYLTGDSKTANGGYKCTGGANAIAWLKAHPGRWALVGEGTTGLSPSLLAREGLTCSSRTSKIDGVTRYYGHLPHPEAEPLIDALKRGRPMEGVHLPEFTLSDFAWTPAELAEACQIARDNLFPVSGRR